MPKKGKKGKPIGKLFYLFLALALITTAAVNFYLLFLLSKVPVDSGKVRRTSILLAVGILVFALLLILLLVFASGLLIKLLSFKSIFIILLLLVVMGLDFAIPPALKRGDVKHAKIFAGVAAAFGTLLVLIVVGFILIKVSKEKKKNGKPKKSSKFSKSTTSSKNEQILENEQVSEKEQVPENDYYNEMLDSVMPYFSNTDAEGSVEEIS